MDYGSVKKKIVHPALKAKREAIDFDQQELQTLILGERRVGFREAVAKIIEENSQFANGPETYWQS